MVLTRAQLPAAAYDAIAERYTELIATDGMPHDTAIPVLLDHLLAVTAAASIHAKRAEAFASQRTGGSNVLHRVQPPVTPASRDPTAGAAPADAVEERLS